MTTTNIWSLVALAAAALVFTAAVVAQENESHGGDEPRVEIERPIVADGLEGARTNITITPAGEDDGFAHPSGHDPLPATGAGTAIQWPDPGFSLNPPGGLEIRMASAESDNSGALSPYFEPSGEAMETNQEQTQAPATQRA